MMMEAYWPLRRCRFKQEILTAVSNLVDVHKDDLHVDTLSRANASISGTCSTSNPRSKVDVEVEIYFGELTVKREDNPMTWWFQNSCRFPSLSVTWHAHQAVLQVRDFSVLLEMNSDNRNRLLPLELSPARLQIFHTTTAHSLSASIPLPQDLQTSNCTKSETLQAVSACDIITK